MNRLLSILMTSILALTSLSYTITDSVSNIDYEAVDYIEPAASSALVVELNAVQECCANYIWESVEAEENELIEAALIETNYYNELVPLTFEEQDYLRAACNEFDIPYALALGLIEKETQFRNVYGDNGASTGYMQIQKRWHSERMSRLGVDDLLEPYGNFRVGCDYLAELYTKYEDWSMALTVYNRGHNPGYITEYAYAVLDNYANWSELMNVYD